MTCLCCFKLKLFVNIITKLSFSLHSVVSSDQFFISRYFGAEVFADFANGALELPFVSMVISATTIVLAPIYSKKAFDGSAKAKEEIIQLWHSVLSKTIKITYPLIAFFYCFADMVMVALYGQAYINSGELVPILDEFREPAEGIWAVYPQNRYLSPKIRLLIDYLAEHLS